MKLEMDTKRKMFKIAGQEWRSMKNFAPTLENDKDFVVAFYRNHGCLVIESLSSGTIQ